MVIKTFTVDWESYDEVSKLGKIIKCRIGEINPNRLSKSKKEGLIFDCCRTIWDTSTLNHYDNLNLDITPKYYIYCHMNEKWKIWPGHNGRLSFAASIGITHSPFYIGKGCGNRVNQLNRNGYHTKLKERFNESGENIFSLIIKNNLTEIESLSYEDKLIDIFGLKVYGGMLANLDEGYKPRERRMLYPYDKLIELTKSTKLPRNYV